MSATGLVVVIIGAWLALPVTAAVAQDEAEKVGKPEKLAKEAEWALASLYEKEPATKTLAENAKAILVFPRITRASVGVGVQRGTGTLLKDGNPEGFYTTTGTSVGLQAGAKTYGYALFFMNDTAVQTLSQAKGFEVGVGPTVSWSTRERRRTSRRRRSSPTSMRSSSTRRASWPVSEFRGTR